MPRKCKPINKNSEGMLSMSHLAGLYGDPRLLFHLVNLLPDLGQLRPHLL